VILSEGGIATQVTDVHGLNCPCINTFAKKTEVHNLTLLERAMGIPSFLIEVDFIAWI